MALVIVKKEGPIIQIAVIAKVHTPSIGDCSSFRAKYMIFQMGLPARSKKELPNKELPRGDPGFELDG